MALAILRFQENDGAKNRFQIEVGSNRFYCYAIGSEIQQLNGIRQLRNVVYTSPLMGPIPESSLGRAVLEIPNDKFDRQNRSIQLTSFRTNDRMGPAYSDVIEVAPVSTNTADRSTHAWGMELDTEPGIGLGIEMEMDRKPTETVPFAYREVQEHPTPIMGEAMAASGGFLSKIGSAVSGAVNGLKQVAGPTLTGALKTLPGKIAGVASQVMPLLDTVNTVAGLVGGGLPGATPNPDPSADGQTGATSGVTDIMAMLMPLLQQLLGGALPATLPSPGVTPALMPPTMPTPPSTMLPPGSATPAPQPVGAVVGQASPQPARRTLAPSGRPANAGRQVAQSMSVSRLPSTAFAFSDETIGGTTDVSETMSYSEAMMLPTIAALLPVMLKATPSVMRMLGTQLGPMTDALLTPKGASPRGMGMMFELDEKEPEETAVIALSLALATATTPDLVYKRIDAVKLSFADTNALMLHGRSRFLYRYDQDVAFPLKVETPKPIKKARLQLLVKHPKTLKILLEQNYRVENITAGTLDVVPQLNQEQLKTLAPNEEYLVCATLVWRATSKQTGEQKRIGTSTLQLITLIREYIFDRVEGTGETIPLNDVDKFRPYWHKVWEDKFSEDVRRINLDCKYYYTLECDRTENARMETVTNLDADLTEKTGKLKAGLILSPYSLNELLGQMQKPSLGEAELSALLNSEFKDRFSHLAQTQVKFKGRKGDTVALWIYPELKLQQVMLKKADNINANGHVLALREYPVYFPMPAMAHFIGAST